MSGNKDTSHISLMTQVIVFQPKSKVKGEIDSTVFTQIYMYTMEFHNVHTQTHSKL